jgi:excisionase family DNA binding protein
VLVVSRQFLIQLPQQGRIPYHMVGTHRRLYARDVLAYEARRDSARRSTLDNLASDEMKEGPYDRMPLNDSDTR